LTTRNIQTSRIFAIVQTPFQILAIMRLLEQVVCTIHNSFGKRSKKRRNHEEKQNQFFFENPKITRKKHILIKQISKIE
jgi:hypothetical protein